MDHPIVSQPGIFKLYGFICLLFISANISINFWGLSLPFDVAIADGLVYNILIFVLGISIWYPIFYIDRTKGRINFLLQYLAVGIVIVGLWLSSGYKLLDLFINKQEFNDLNNSQVLLMRIILGGLIYVLFVLVYYMLIFYNELEERKQQQERINRLLRETELKALKSQLNPHFLFNSLNSISALTITGPEKARDMINKLSSFMRYSLRNKEDSLLPLKDELENMERYLAIEKVRFGERLLIESYIPEPCKAMKIPAMLLQPLYENAIKHGVYESLEPVTIGTNCHYKDEALEIRISNRFDPDATTRPGEGVGLNNVQERLRLIYNRGDLISIKKEENMFEVQLRLPQEF